MRVWPRRPRNTPCCLVCLRAGLALAMFVLLGVAVPGVGHAGMRKCEDHSLDADDEMALRAAALKVLRKAVHVDDVGACRNPRSAYAWISTRKATSIEGVQQLFEITCSRKAQPWRCDPPELTQLISLAIGVGDAKREVELRFAPNTSLERAKVLVARALAIYADPTARLPSCLSDDAKDDRLLSVLWERRDPLKSDPIHVSVGRDEKIDTVSLDDISIDIGFPVTPDETAAPLGVCWNEFVVVA
jgi:hypothetical protein